MAAPGKALFWDKLKIKRGMQEEIVTFNNQALCFGSEDPDLWFSEEIEDLGRRGGPTMEQKEVQIQRSIAALKICAQCKVQDLCLQEGMREPNLDWGIWGGKMSAERLILAGASIRSSQRINKVLFAKKVRARLREA